MKNNIYDSKAEGKSLKLQPKAIYSSEYRERGEMRVAAYCRVSTDKKEQQESYEIQAKHYKKYITEREGWTLAGIYADEESGTSTKRRKDFIRMIKDAEAGKFDMIITKDVSRFARNVVDGIKTTRDLLRQNPPVGVLFENDNFNTFREDSEFILSMMLIVAQGESIRKSTAIKRAFQWRCDDHRYLTPVDSLLGYEKGEDKKLVIEPEGAKTVKAIYAMFLHGLPASRIAFILSLSGKVTGKNRSNWSPSSVTGILRNEKYCGDVVGQKTVTTDPLEHKSVKNSGQATLHYMDNHHEPIITRDEYIRALYLLRSNSSSKYYNPNYEIEVILEGLLMGFIPINLAFGGYDAVHYLGAESISNVKPNDYSVSILTAPDYRLIRAQEIEHSRIAQMTISKRNISLSSDCISKLPDTEYVEMLLHPSERLLAIRPSTVDNKNAVPWNKKSLSGSAFCPILYELMGWNKSWKYKIMADVFIRDSERLLMFNLSEPQFQFVEEVKENEEIINRIRRLLCPNSWKDNIGADYITQMIASRRAYALSLDKWKSNEVATPISGFPGNPVNRDMKQLIKYLDSLGVQYV